MSLDVEAVEAVNRMRRLGDDLLDVEAKSAAGGLPRRGLLETCCAFANTEGGFVLLGVAQEAGFQVVDIQASKLASDWPRCVPTASTRRCAPRSRYWSLREARSWLPGSRPWTSTSDRHTFEIEACREVSSSGPTTATGS